MIFKALAWFCWIVAAVSITLAAIYPSQPVIVLAGLVLGPTGIFTGGISYKIVSESEVRP